MMNPEDVRRLIGGYATGSLSEAERQLLLDAALDDQELFDELAGEQVLKEILEEPGARQRLLSALGNEQKSAQAPWWSRSWPWMGAAVTVAVAIIIVVAQRTPPPLAQEIAQVLKPTEPVAAPAPPASSAPQQATPKVLRKDAPPPALADAPKPSADAIEEARSDKAQVQAAAPAPPSPAPPSPTPQAQRVIVGAASEFAARGGRAEALSANAVSAFGFYYTVRADKMLEIIPSSAGFLSVADGANVLRPSGGVVAGTPVRVQIPAGTMSLTVGFYAVQGISSAAVRRDETSGTVTDQDPPNGRISIQLFLTPGTQ